MHGKTISDSLDVRTLFCRSHLQLGIRAMRTLVEFSKAPVSITFHDDGSLDTNDREKIIKSFPEAKIITSIEADATMLEVLKNYPACLRFRRQNILARKLLDIPFMAEGDFVYMDTDVFFFKPFSGLFQWPSNDIQAMFMRDFQSAYCITSLRGMFELKILNKVNTGLMYLRKNLLDLEFLENLLQKNFIGINYHWSEQTCWAVLAARFNCIFWDPSQVAVIRPESKFSENLIAGHFVTPVRYMIKEYLQSSCSTGTCDYVKTMGADSSTGFRLMKQLIRPYWGYMLYLIHEQKQLVRSRLQHCCGFNLNK